jgi:hypothetical protein
MYNNGIHQIPKAFRLLVQVIPSVISIENIKLCFISSEGSSTIITDKDTAPLISEKKELEDPLAFSFIQFNRDVRLSEGI